MSPAELENLWPKNIAIYYRNQYTGDSASSSPVDFHNGYAEILQIVSGSMLINLPGGKSIRLMPGDVVYFSEPFPCEFLAEPETETRNLQFDLRWFLQKNGFCFSFFATSEANNRYTVFENGTEINKQLTDLLDIAEKKEETKINEYLYGAVFSVIGLLINNRIIRLPGDSDYKLYERLASSFEYIQENFREKLSLEDIADMVGYNKDYLSRIFKSATGMTVIEFINNIRIEEARHLLLNTDKSVTEIALEAGFGSNAYFSRLFRKKYAVTPNKYRLNSKTL